MNHRTFFHRMRMRPGCSGGFSLIVVLIFLVVLSLLAVFAVRGVITSERMAGNTQDWNLAFQAAEAALRDGEGDVAGAVAAGVSGSPVQRSTGAISGALGFTADCTAGLCLPATTVNSPPVWSTASGSPLANDNGWTAGAANGSPSVLYGTYTRAAPLPDPANAANALPFQPRYIIENLGPVGMNSVVTGSYSSGSPPMNGYRVTAVGFGKIVTFTGTPATRVVLQSTINR